MPRDVNASVDVCHRLFDIAAFETSSPVVETVFGSFFLDDRLEVVVWGIIASCRVPYVQQSCPFFRERQSWLIPD